MTHHFRWLIPVGSLALGLYLLPLSYRAYAKWVEYIALGDHSGAEVYEIEFWPEVVLSVAFILLGAFLAGRWSMTQASNRSGEALGRSDR